MMDAEFRRYLGGVKLDEPPASSSDPRWEETETLARRLLTEGKAEAALKLVEQEPARRKRWDLLLLTGLLREGLEEQPLALEALEVVADKLVASGDRSGVRLLLDRFRDPEPTSAAVRFLQYLARGETKEEARIALLREAIEIRPADPELHAEISPLSNGVATSPTLGSTDFAPSSSIWSWGGRSVPPTSCSGRSTRIWSISRRGLGGSSSGSRASRRGAMRSRSSTSRSPS